MGRPAAALGALLFAMGWLGSASVQLLPFDGRHAIGQLWGGLLLIVGVCWTTS